MPFTFVSGVMVLKRGDNITTHILNFGSTLESIRVRIFNRTGAVISDSGDVKVSPRLTTASSFALTDADEVWVEIAATAETIVPLTYFVRPSPTIENIAIFRGGDFATFDAAGKRLW